MSTAPTAAPSRWQDAWPDLLGFAAGLTAAWVLRWRTADLVWSLWLSSLVIGFATFAWVIFGPAFRAGRAGKTGAAAGLAIGGGLLMAFFTVHFGLFHAVHSIFLNLFFPVGPKTGGLINVELYGQVLRQYWWFLPAALLSERAVFRTGVPAGAEPGTPQELRRAADSLGAPYKRVVRLHLLIFFFAGAAWAGLDGFPVYVVVYAVYFFPWHLLRRGRSAAAA